MKNTQIKMRYGNLSGFDNQNCGVQLAVVYNDKILVDIVNITKMKCLKKLTVEEIEGLLDSISYNINILVMEMRSRDIFEMDDEKYFEYATQCQ